MSVRVKTAYHPYLLVAFYLHCLPPDIIDHIPRSTRHDWNHKDTTTLFGYDWYLQNHALFDTLQQISINKRLLRVNRALIHIIALKRFISRYAQSKINGVNQVIINHIYKIRCLFDLKTTLKCLQLPFSWYLQIRRKQGCSLL